MRIKWAGANELPPVRFVCWNCNVTVGPHQGYLGQWDMVGGVAAIYLCPVCNSPSFLPSRYNVDTRYPSPEFGNRVEALPKDVEAVYNEARRVMSVDGHTAAVLLCRKLLMSIAVSKNAEEGQDFVYYVNYLTERGFIPPDAKKLADRVRTSGNDATHRIAMKSQADAELLISFCEMLLKLIFEFPKKMDPKTGI